MHAGLCCQFVESSMLVIHVRGCLPRMRLIAARVVDAVRFSLVLSIGWLFGTLRSHCRCIVFGDSLFVQ